jgi:hypothetical protein
MTGGITISSKKNIPSPYVVAAAARPSQVP